MPCAFFQHKKYIFWVTDKPVIRRKLVQYKNILLVPNFFAYFPRLKARKILCKKNLGTRKIFLVLYSQLSDNYYLLHDHVISRQLLHAINGVASYISDVSFGKGHTCFGLAVKTLSMYNVCDWQSRLKCLL